MFEIERVGILLMRFNPFDELMFDVVKGLGILWGPVLRTPVATTFGQLQRIRDPIDV